MSDHAQLERLTARLAEVDPAYLNALERLLERLPQAPEEDGARQEPNEECNCLSVPATQERTGGGSRTKIFINPDLTEEKIGLLSLILEAVIHAEHSAGSKPQLQPGMDYDSSDLPPDFWGGAPSEIELGSTRSLPTLYGEIFGDEEPS